MIDLLLDPDKALDAVNKAVALVKKASKTVDNVESLGPLLGKYFDAKAQAVAVAQHAKGTKSSMGKAMEIELAIEAQKDFENQLKNLFWSANKMDVWMRIKQREAATGGEILEHHGVEERGAVRLRIVARVVVKPHLAIAESAEKAAMPMTRVSRLPASVPPG